LLVSSSWFLAFVPEKPFTTIFVFCRTEKHDEGALASFLGTCYIRSCFSRFIFLTLPSWGAAVLRPYDLRGKLVSP
jgi:hypothetical protein